MCRRNTRCVLSGVKREPSSSTSCRIASALSTDSASRCARRRLDAGAGAHEQRVAEHQPQPAERVADGRLRDAEPQRRAATCSSYTARNVFSKLRSRSCTRSSDASLSCGAESVAGPPNGRVRSASSGLPRGDGRRVAVTPRIRLREMAEAVDAVCDQHVGHAARVAVAARVHGGEPAFAHAAAGVVWERAECVLQRGATPATAASAASASGSPRCALT